MLIEGRKKGGGRAPQEAADSLRSTQIAEVVHLISEGECRGLVNGLKSVYLDGVAVENADGSKNFDNVDFAYVPGSQGQAALPGMQAVQNEVVVGLQVNQATPIVRTISTPSIDHVRVTITVPSLTRQKPSNGDIVGSSFEWAVDVQSAGGGFVERHRETIEGKTTSAYSKAVRIQLTGSAPWDVRVRRITEDPPTVNIVNRFTWTSYTEITSVKLRYPNSAVSMLRVNAQNFGRVPEAKFDWMGLVVKVPSNYNPLTRAYSGAWNGTFVDDWTNNPAWCTYDIVSKNRYGLGDFVPGTLLNKWQLYAIGQYSDALVPDGRGGLEPRLTCNLDLRDRQQALKVLQSMAAIFRGMAFWAGGSVEFVQDAPSDAVHTFTNANVVDGLFTYSDTSEQTRHSMFICWWNDLAQLGKATPEVFVDETLVARYGVRELELAPLGITSRGQAARVCRWARHSEEMEGELVTFETGSDGQAVAPGKRFKVADAHEQGERLAGRIRAATASQVTLDAQVTLQPGETYQLTVLQPDPADAMTLLTERRTVTTGPGLVDVITVATPFSAAPLAQTVWLLESSAIGATWWTCLERAEVKGKNRYRITGVAHNPGKFDAVELGLKLDTRPVSRLTLAPKRPASVALAETIYFAGPNIRSRVTASWPQPERGLLYAVSWRMELGPWHDLPATSANSVDVEGLPLGLFEVSVKSLNALGNGSLARTAALELLGKAAKPGNVAGLAAAALPGVVRLSWTGNVEIDYLETELRVGASWAAGTRLYCGAADRFDWAWPAVGTYTVWAKHRDTTRNESNTAISIGITVTATSIAITSNQLNVQLGGGNLLKNSSFEADSDGNGIPDSWTDTSIGTGITISRTLTTVASAVVHGLNAVRWAVTAIASPTSLSTHAALMPEEDCPTVLEGQKYTVSIYMRTSQAVYQGMVGVRWLDSAGAQISIDQHIHTFSAVNQTERAVLAGLTPPAGAVKARVQYGLRRPSVTHGALGTMWFDAVQFEAGEVVTGYTPKTDEVLPGTIDTVELAPNASFEKWEAFDAAGVGYSSFS